MAVKSVYLLTINQQPARWIPDALDKGRGQICYIDHGDSLKSALVKDLLTVRRHIRDTKANRVAWGFQPDAGKYGYIRLTV